MEKPVKYLILSICMSLGAFTPTLLGAGSLSGWSFLGSTLGGVIAIFIIAKLN